MAVLPDTFQPADAETGGAASVPPPPPPAKPTAPNTVEYTLALQSAQAIKQGADPEAVANQHMQYLLWLKQHPDARQNAQDAINKGADAFAVANQTAAYANQHPPKPQPAQSMDAALPNPSALSAVGQGVAATLANIGGGFPGGEAAEAYLASKANGIPYAEALQDIRDATGKIPGPARYAGRALGALAATPILPGGAILGGATFGAAQGALAADPMSWGARALNTGIGAGAGAVTGAAMQGLGNLATRSGLADKIGDALRNPAPSSNLEMMVPSAPQAQPGAIGRAAVDVGNALGVRGAANQALATRQDLLNQIPGGDAAQTMVDHVAAKKAQADALYGLARQDTKLVTDPKVQRLVNDPDLQQIFQVARAINGTQPAMVDPGAPAVPGTSRMLSQGRPPEPPLIPSGAPQSTREAIQAFDASRAAAVGRSEGTTSQQMARTALERRSAEASLPNPAANVTGVSLQAPRTAVPEVPPTYADIPTPSDLAMTKRILNDAMTGRFNAGSTISQQQALALQPKLVALRAALHGASQPYADADLAYATASNMEDAFTKSTAAQVTPKGAALNPSKLRNAPAIEAWAGRGATPMQAARSAGSQLGYAARIYGDVQNQPLTALPNDVRGAALLGNAPAQAALRARAFATPEGADQFTTALGNLPSQGWQPPRFGPVSQNPLTWANPVLRGGAPASNPLASSEGNALLTQLAPLIGTPRGQALMASTIRGRALLDALQQAGVMGALAGRGMPAPPSSP